MPTDWLHKHWVYYALYQYFKKYTCTPSRECNVFSFSGEEIHVANECMRCALNRGPTCSKAVSSRSQAKYTSEEKVKKGVPKHPSQGCSHFSQLLDGKLPWGSEALSQGGYDFGWGTASSNLKFAKLKNIVFWPKTPNLMPTIWYTVYRACTVTHQTQSVDSCLYYNWREFETAQEGDNLICR